MGETARAELVAAPEGVLDRRGDRLRAIGIGAHRRVAARLVHRLVRRADDRCAAGHRLDHRQPEALEPRRVDERGGAAVEPCELVVVDIAEPDDARQIESGLLAPALGADDGEHEVVVPRPGEGIDERGEVLPRLERRHGEHVRTAEIGRFADGAEHAVDAGRSDTDTFLRDAEQLDRLQRRESGVGEQHVARPRRVSVLRGVHAARASLDPFRETDRHEIMDRRCPDAAPL